MKKLLLLSCLLFTFHAIFAQATLPTSWDFDGTTPTGWTLTGTNFYTSAFAHTIPSCKFDGTDDNLVIHFSDAAGPVDFYIRGSGAWDGEFEVQESDDGVTYTTMINYMSGSLNTASHTLVTTDLPLATTRYIRFYYINKVSGSNVSIDDLTIPVAPAGPAQEINILSGMDPIPSGGTASVSAPFPGMNTLTLTVENQGTQDDLTLDIASSTISDPAFAFAAGTPTSLVVAAGATQAVDIVFTPTMLGTHTGLLNLVNDDANEGNYNVLLYGVGGGLATEPTQNGTLTATNLKSYRFDANINVGQLSDGHLVLRTDAAFADAPVDGTVYQVGDQIGNSKVVYIGSGSSFFPRGIIANTDFYYAVFAYNGFDSFINYNQATPTTTTVTTPDADPGTYYSGLNTSSATFVNDLQTLVSPHFQQFYSNYDKSMINLFYADDTTGNQKTIECNYSSTNLVYTDPFSWTSTSYTREHTLPSSWMRTWPDTETIQYSDYHNLYPVRGNVNSDRGAFPFGEVVTPTTVFGDGMQGFDANGDIVYEPRDENKGDAVRCMMYMIVTYDGEGGSWALKDLLSNADRQSETIMKQWHFDDPPSNIELARNDFIDSLQNNRNPFIDHPEFACLIDFYNRLTISSPTAPPCLPTTANEEVNLLAQSTLVSPNPASTMLQVEINNSQKGDLQLEILDIAGKSVRSFQYVKQGEVFEQTLDVEGLNNGFYLLSITIDGHTAAKKFVIRN